MIKISDNNVIVKDASPREVMAMIQGLIRLLHDKGLDAYEIVGIISETVYRLFDDEEGERNDDNDL